MGLSFENLIYYIPAVLIAITFHEFAHGYISHRLGDPTPRNTGRLTLNPKAHLDPVGTLCLLFFGFGWAKPVRVNPYFYDNKKSGMVKVALAGPMTNFIVAFVSYFFMGLLYKFINGDIGMVLDYFLNLFAVTASINIGLGVFNLIPFPPLDGSKILNAILPSDLYFKIMEYESYGQIILFGLLYLGFLDTPLYFLRSGVTEFMMTAINTILRLG